MASERPVTRSPLARVRCSAPTISGTLLRSATWDRVEQQPVTTARPYSRATRASSGASSSTTTAAPWQRSAPTMSRFRSNDDTRRPLRNPEATPQTSRTAMNNPAAKALRVTS